MKTKLKTESAIRKATKGSNGTDGTAFRRVTEKDRRVACATQSEQRKRPPLARMMKTYELL